MSTPLLLLLCRGLIPDMSATVTLKELIPRDVALELTLTGRVFVADEARSLGLVTRIADDPLAEALRLAGDIAARSPDAAAAAKRLLHATYSEGCNDARALHVCAHPVRADRVRQ